MEEVSGTGPTSKTTEVSTFTGSSYVQDTVHITAGLEKLLSQTAAPSTPASGDPTATPAPTGSPATLTSAAPTATSSGLAAGPRVTDAVRWAAAGGALAAAAAIGAF
jgi:hypothetical protein